MVMDTAPQTKLNAIQRLGAEIVPIDLPFLRYERPADIAGDSVSRKVTVASL